MVPETDRDRPSLRARLLGIVVSEKKKKCTRPLSPVCAVWHAAQKCICKVTPTRRRWAEVRVGCRFRPVWRSAAGAIDVDVEDVWEDDQDWRGYVCRDQGYLL